MRVSSESVTAVPTACISREKRILCMANVSRMKSALVCDNVEAYLNYLTAIMMNGTVAVVSLKAEGNENAAAVLQSFTTWPLALGPWPCEKRLKLPSFRRILLGSAELPALALSGPEGPSCGVPDRPRRCAMRYEYHRVLMVPY